MQGSVMEVRWSLRARINYLDTLDFWYRHNKSYAYSQKIIDAVDILEKELKETPYFLANYIEHLELYKKSFLNYKFAVYYEEVCETLELTRSSLVKTLPRWLTSVYC